MITENMMIGGESLKIGSDNSEVKWKIKIIKTSIKVIERVLKRFDEFNDIEWFYDELEAEQIDLVSQNMDLDKRIHTLERDMVVGR